MAKIDEQAMITDAHAFLDASRADITQKRRRGGTAVGWENTFPAAEAYGELSRKFPFTGLLP